MNVQMFKRTLLNLPPKKSVLVESKHGMGKSQVVAQCAAEMSKRLKKPFGFVDIRLGQYEVGDLIGMPEKQPEFTIVNKVFKNGALAEEKTVATNVTVHDLPLWFPRDKESCGYLFFDELNRGSRDTQQWAFQVVLDYRVNFHDVPDGWSVIAACNDDQDAYNILALDPALYDRFLVIKFRPTVAEWLKHAVTIKVHDAVVKYIKKCPKDLDPPDKLVSGTRYPSRRSWVSLSDVIQYMTANGDNVLADLDYMSMLAIGYVGPTIALNFISFLKKNYKVYTPAEILSNFPKFKEEFEKMVPTDLTYYNEELIDHIKEMKTNLSPKQCANLLDYIQTVPKEIRAGFWTVFSNQASAQAIHWFKSDKKIAVLLQEGYQKPPTL
jgi:MoxR-like ATPase